MKNGTRPRLMSVDRTSYVGANPSTNVYQQQLAANTTNKYYVQLYDFYRNSSGLKKNQTKNWNKKFVHSISTNTKSDNRIFYHKILTKNAQKQACDKTINVISNPVLVCIDENEMNHSVDTLVTNSTNKVRLVSVTNV